MARLYVGDFIDIATGAGHEATSRQVAKDKDFTQIIDESLLDYQNITEWVTPLPKRPEDGPGFYKAEEELYARMRIHMGNTASNWVVVGPETQQFQKITITQDDMQPIETDSNAINLHFTK